MSLPGEPLRILGFDIAGYAVDRLLRDGDAAMLAVLLDPWCAYLSKGLTTGGRLGLLSCTITCACLLPNESESDSADEVNLAGNLALPPHRVRARLPAKKTPPQKKKHTPEALVFQKIQRQCTDTFYSFF